LFWFYIRNEYAHINNVLVCGIHAFIPAKQYTGLQLIVISPNSMQQSIDIPTFHS